MPNYKQSTLTLPMLGITPGLMSWSFGAPIAIAVAASPGGLVRAAGGVVTLTTSVAHGFQIGQTVSLGFDVVSIPGYVVANGLPNTSVLGTRFGGRYVITAIGSATTATLVPLEEVILHQPPDTGGAGTAISIGFEQPTAPQAGQAFGLQGAFAQLPGSNPAGFSVFGQFSAAPGVFEVDVQVADVDADASYQTLGPTQTGQQSGVIAAVDATNFTFHADFQLTAARFVRLKILTRTNAVGFVGGISRG